MIKRELANMILNIYQPHLIIKKTQGFIKDMKLRMTFNTPYEPYKGIVRNQETDMKISNSIQKRYRIGVGSLLDLVRYSYLNMSNAVLELSKCKDEANIGHSTRIFYMQSSN